MTITARYSSICPTCRRPINPGDQVEWQRGAKATHTTCSPGASAVPAPSARRSPSRGRRTGCSCGSREDASGALIDSPRNCAQCRFDGE